MRGSRQTLPTLLEECDSTKLLCEIAATTFDQGQAYSNSKVYWWIVELSSLGKIVFFCHIIVIVTSFRPVCKKGESPMPRSFLHRLQRTGPCSYDWKVKKRKQFLILMVFVGLGTVSARSHLWMRWRTVLTSSTGSKRCRNSSFLGRSHLAGRYVI